MISKTMQIFMRINYSSDEFQYKNEVKTVTQKKKKSLKNIKNIKSLNNSILNFKM